MHHGYCRRPPMILWRTPIISAIMALITLLDAQLAFGHVALLDHAGFSLETAERIGLIGRNGAGKSSLLKILGGLAKPDDGTLQVQQGVRIAYVAQEPSLDPEATIFKAASEGLQRVIAVRDQYLSGAEGLDLDALQSVIEAYDAWNWEQRVEETLQRLHLDPDAVVGTLSGGTKKRVALAQALVARPDVLLLDEPTNHLDLDSIEWLEDLLLDFPGSVVTITHDRAFSGPGGPRELWSWTEGNCAPIPATSPSTLYRRKTNSHKRLSFPPKQTNCWRRKKYGFAEASKPGAHAVKVESRGLSTCARAVKHGGTWWEASRWTLPRVHKMAIKARSWPS